MDESGKQPPSVLVVIVDDMGVHQIGCHGGGFYETPRIDCLASTGVKFNCAYSAAPVCSPARAALYTGMHPARLHLTNYIPGTEPENPRLLTPPWRAYLPVEVETLGDVFKTAGYATGHFGKWHLAPDYHYSPGRPMDPESQGFDTVTVTRKPMADAEPEKDPHHVDSITSDAMRFITAAGANPFLCIVAHNSLHRPEMAPASLIAKYAAKPGANGGAKRAVVGAMVEHVDTSIGQLLDHLESSGRARDTIVVFTSDHGAFGPTSERKPLRGAKADLYEGGIRVPFIWSWQGRIAQGERATPVFGADLFPTLLDLCGLQSHSPCDGVSITGAVLEPGREPPARDEFCWHFPHYHHLGIAPCGAIRSGRWKLVEWFERTIGGCRDGSPFELYDLDADPGESMDLSTRHPGVCAELSARLAAWRKRIGAQEMKPNPRFNPGDIAHAMPPPPTGDPGNPFGE